MSQLSSMNLTPLLPAIYHARLNFCGEIGLTLSIFCTLAMYVPDFDNSVVRHDRDHPGVIGRRVVSWAGTAFEHR
jgi:hypothetical protein